jgi:deoxyribodipyrimidine photo-lyase
MTAIIWFRRDLRVSDQPIFLAAAESSPRSLGVFVLDPALLEPAGAARRNFLYGCLRELDASLGGRLLVVRGTPAELLPRIVAAAGARTVHVAADFAPYGAQRDRAVEDGLAALGVRLVRTGSPYAVAPGRVTTGAGRPFRVFTPFRRAWHTHGWRLPAASDADTVDWLDPATIGVDRADIPAALELTATLPEPGERAALRRWRGYSATGLADYSRDRNRPDVVGTSGMSPYLRFGCIHPRTMLADDPPDLFRSELAWREFYADVLHQRPDSARHNYDPAFDALPTATHADAGELFAAWQEGRTGYPIVDAGMRQLRTTAWMHNRVRMITASFLVKDLHLPWQWGARHFMRLLVDGDLASNQHGWQWVAGSGTDAAPYFRVLNPTLQGEKFDPDGDYVRTHVPELAAIPGPQVHQPWRLPATITGDYPARIVDHAEERRQALADYERVKKR